jgi:hypothetical protein
VKPTQCSKCQLRVSKQSKARLLLHVSSGGDRTTQVLFISSCHRKQTDDTETVCDVMQSEDGIAYEQMDMSTKILEQREFTPVLSTSKLSDYCMYRQF